jgi:hypothetical protein
LSASAGGRPVGQIAALLVLDEAVAVADVEVITGDHTLRRRFFLPVTAGRRRSFTHVMIPGRAFRARRQRGTSAIASLVTANSRCGSPATTTRDAGPDREEDVDLGRQRIEQVGDRDRLRPLAGDGSAAATLRQALVKPRDATTLPSGAMVVLKWPPSG